MNSLDQKHHEIIQAFSGCTTPESVYVRIIEIGQQKQAACLWKHPQYLVPGCQSQLYLKSEVRNEKLFFEVYSEALISKGLAELLVWYYNAESAETLLKEPPHFLETLQIPGSLTPGRANGLYNIHLKMKQTALNSLVSTKEF